MSSKMKKGSSAGSSESWRALREFCQTSRDDLSDKQRVVWFHLWAMSGRKTELAKFSIRRLERETGYHRTTVKRCLTSLANLGYIKPLKRGNKYHRFEVLVSPRQPLGVRTQGAT